MEFQASKSSTSPQGEAQLLLLSSRNCTKLLQSLTCIVNFIHPQLNIFKCSTFILERCNKLNVLLQQDKI